jgi:hypothetical protein
MTNHLYLPIVVLLIGGAGFAVGPLALAWLWAKMYSPQKSGPSKNATYECGLESTGDAWIKFKPGYYLYAIAFLNRSTCWFFYSCWLEVSCGPAKRNCCPGPNRSAGKLLITPPRQTD